MRSPEGVNSDADEVKSQGLGRASDFLSLRDKLDDSPHAQVLDNPKQISPHRKHSNYLHTQF